MDKCYGYRTVNEYGKKLIQLEPGEEYNGFDEYAQYGATYEKEDINWDQGTTQRKIFEEWKSQGKKTDNNNLAFITMGGGDWYLVAMGTSLGNVGDYVELTIKNRNTPFPAIIADRKSGSDAGAVFARDKKNSDLYWHLGHGYEGKVNMLEIILKNYEKKPSPEYLASLQTVTTVKNGGSYMEHPEGPVGLTGSYKIEADLSSIENSSATSKVRNAVKKKAETLGSVIISFFRSLATMGYTFTDNLVSGGEDADIMYYLVDPDAQQNNQNSNAVPSVGDPNLMKTCNNLAHYLMSKHAHYGWPYENLTYRNLEKNYREPDYNVVCATYVSIALWLSGQLDLSFINRKSYNAADGVAEMVREAGWHKVELGINDPRQEGDILVQPGTHAAISAGGWKVWEESCGVIGSNGAPTGEAHTYSKGYMAQFDVYRK